MQDITFSAREMNAGIFHRIVSEPLRPLSRSLRRRRIRLSEEMRDQLNSVEDYKNLQLISLNSLWSRACAEIPFYQELRQRGVPDSFASLEDYAKLVPIFTKQTLQSVGDRAFSQADNQQVVWKASGGSTTAEPTRFPRSVFENTIQESCEWYLRSLIGITPDDPYFRIWGHRHLLGRGLSRQVRIFERALKDKSLGMVRFSAYDLSQDKVRQGIKKLERAQITYVLGFSRALEAFATELIELKKTVHLPALKGVIATAETFSSDHSRRQVEEAFGCPVYMEYGSMETGPIAQEVSGEGYIVAWNHYLLEAVPTDEGTHRLLVTTLYPRAFPLFRYDLGDLVSGFNSTIGITRFQMIEGRCNPLFIAPSGHRIHSVPIIHSMEAATNSARVYQVGLTGERISGIYLVPYPGKESGIDFNEIRRRLNKVDKGLGEIPIEIIPEPLLTPAGKRPVFVQVKPAPEIQSKEA